MTGIHTLAYGILLTATASLGVGFGLTVPAINTLAAGFFPAEGRLGHARPQCLAGTGHGAGAGLCRALRGPGRLVGPAVLVGVAALGCWLFSLPLPLGQGRRTADARRQKGKTPLPARFWVFAGFALLYGIFETMNGNWATLYMTQRPRSEHRAGLAGVDRLLGGGDRRPRPLRRHREWFPEHAHLSRPALRGGGCLRRRRAAAEEPAVSRHRGLRLGRAGLFGASAADHQLRREGTDDDRRLGGGRPDRVLPDGLRHRGLRRRTAAASTPV